MITFFVSDKLLIQLTKKVETMPVLYKEDSDMIILPVDYTPHAIEREFIKLVRMDFQNVEAYLYMQKNGKFAAVVKAKPNDRGRCNCIAKLDLVSVSWSDAVAVNNFFEKEPAQVEGVIVDEAYRHGELAFNMYEYLVTEQGLSIISDSEQYKGGQAIWKKLARESKALSVYPFNVDVLQFYPNAEGEKVRYDGNNIDDDLLWSIDPDTSKEHIVLIAQSN